MTPETPDFNAPASVVRGFIRQMHFWEGLAGSLAASIQARYRPGGGSSLHPEETRLSTVFKQIPPFIADIYLTQLKKPRETSVSYSIPPQYDPATEKVVRVVPKTKSQVVVETDRKADFMGGPRQYLLKRQDDGWRIDSITVTLGTQKRKLTII